MSKAIEVLRGLEWDRIAVCPICAFTRTHGHAPGCALDAALMECDNLPTFPAHKCALSLTHNDHRNVYETLTDYIANRDLAGDFVCAEAMQRAIDTDEIWELQWYPETPIGSHLVAAPTLAEVLSMVATDKGDGWIAIRERLPAPLQRIELRSAPLTGCFRDDSCPPNVWTHWRELPPPPQAGT